MTTDVPDFVSAVLADAAAAGRLRSLRPVRRLSARECEFNGRRYLDFSSNDYMGYSVRPELKDEARRWLERSGSGSGAARLISGTSDECLALEAKIAAWKGFEAALIVGSGYMGNLGAVEALAHRDSTILADKLNHASINKGCALSMAKFLRYKHKDLNHLNLLSARSSGPVLLVSDTVFSMDGDLADCAALASAASSGNWLVYLDDAHGSGVFGLHGKGLASPENCHVALVTFSKALGSYGAALLCSRKMKEYLVNVCAPFIFSTALPPAVLGAVSAAVDLMGTAEADRDRARLLRNSAHVRAGLQALGYNTGASESMIIPVIVGAAEDTLRLSAALLEQGIYALAVRPPTVPVNTSRIRISLNAAHTDSDVERLIDAFRRAR